MTLVIDASAMVAINFAEPGHERLIERLATAEQVWAAPVNLLEFGMALARRPGSDVLAHTRAWLESYQIVTSGLILFEPALDAFLRFGKGRHPARLNLADCFAYALARTLDAPLLFVGNDFPQTDIRPAL